MHTATPDERGEALLDRERDQARAEARGVWVWCPRGVPPQLHTAEYARAELRPLGLSPELEDAVVQERMFRVSLVATRREEPVEYRFLLADIERPPLAASERVASQTYAQIADVNQLDHVQVRVLPAHLRTRALCGVSGMDLYPNATVTTWGPEGAMTPLEGELAARARFRSLWHKGHPYPGCST